MHNLKHYTDCSVTIGNMWTKHTNCCIYMVFVDADVAVLALDPTETMALYDIWLNSFTVFVL